jgi:hypothetical protein
MRCLRFLAISLPLIFAADGALAASKHEQTRRSASGKGHRSSGSRDRHHRDADTGEGGSDFLGSCLSGCFSAGCDIAGQAAVDAAEEIARDEPAPPPAPGLEPGLAPRWEPAPPEREERPVDLPESLVPAGPGPGAEQEEDVDEAPPWMPGPAESAAGRGADEGEATVPVRRPASPAPGPERPAADRATASPELRATRAPVVPAAGESDPRPAVAYGKEAGGSDFDAPEAFGVAPAPAPRPAPPVPDPGRADFRATGSWIVADLPNASLDVRAAFRTRDAGPGIEVWYTGLWERIEGNWDHLPAGGLRFAFGFGDERVRPELRLGAAFLHLGPRDDRFAFDGGFGLEAHFGDADAPWLDIHTDALLFDGFTGSDLGLGVSFPGGPCYVRVGFRSVYLETYYAGPEVALGVRL